MSMSENVVTLQKSTINCATINVHKACEYYFIYLAIKKKLAGRTHDHAQHQTARTQTRVK